MTHKCQFFTKPTHAAACHKPLRPAGGGGREGGRGGFEGGREEFMKRFDADGDGTISESERNAIRDHFRNGGGNSGGGQGGGGGGRP